jgi:hypothetical protein
MKVKVKNIASDRKIERLGHLFKPGEEVEIEIYDRHLFLLQACRFLEVEEVKEKSASSKKKSKDDN